MPYTVNVNDPTQPIDTVDRSTAAAEFRGLKGFLVGATTIASAAMPNPFAAPTNIIDYTGTVTCTGFTAAPVAGMRRTLVCAEAAVFTAGANLRIAGVTSGQNLAVVAGQVLELVAITTTLFSIGVLGYVAASDVAFRLEPAASFEYIGSPTKITLGAELLDTAAACSASRFTCPTSGLYHIDFSAAIRGDAVTKAVLLYKNGAQIQGASCGFTAQNYGHALAGSLLVNLTVGDYLELYGSVNGGTNYIQGGDYESAPQTHSTYLQGYLVKAA